MFHVKHTEGPAHPIEARGATVGAIAPSYPHYPFSRREGIPHAAADVKIENRLCAELGVELDECVAYGDSMSDAEIFAAVPVAVAINVGHHLSGLTAHAYTGGGLREANEPVCQGRWSKDATVPSQPSERQGRGPGFPLSS
jgi:hypothetical protein